MADAKHLLEFLEGGIGMLFDLGLEFLRVEFAPVSPAGFRGQRAGFGGVQIPINGTPGQVEPPGGLGFGAARFDEVHHPFPQVQRICFHALKPITLCPNVNVKCYSVNGFPTLIAMKPDGTVVGTQTGYLEGGPPALIAKLDEAKKK